MKAFKLILGLYACLQLTACSNHWREFGGDLTAEDVTAVLDEVNQASVQSQGSGSMTEALALKDDINASIYYAESRADQAFGKVPNILGLYDYTFLGQDANFGYSDIRNVRVIFMDAPQPDGSRKASLIIGLMTTGDQFNYYAFSGSSALGDDYVAKLSDGTNTISVTTFDFTESGLDTVIQLRLYDQSGNYLGKISTLMGFHN